MSTTRHSNNSGLLHEFMVVMIWQQEMRVEPIIVPKGKWYVVEFTMVVNALFGKWFLCHLLHILVDSCPWNSWFFLICSDYWAYIFLHLFHYWLFSTNWETKWSQLQPIMDIVITCKMFTVSLNSAFLAYE